MTLVAMLWAAHVARSIVARIILLPAAFVFLSATELPSVPGVAKTDLACFQRVITYRRLIDSLILFQAACVLLFAGKISRVRADIAAVTIVLASQRRAPPPGGAAPRAFLPSIQLLIDLVH